LEGDADGSAKRFLTAPQKNTPVDFSGTVKGRKLVIKKSRAQHETIRGEMRFSDHICRAGFKRGSQHDA
jgi:hypothetical protein